MAKVGDMIGGKYEILRQLQSGGMSHIYVAMKHNLNKTWCVKELVKNPEDSQMNIKIQQALTEAKIMAKLKHEFLPSIVDVFDEEEALYIVMDFIEGDNLKTVMQKKGAQTQEDVIKWAKQLTRVLMYLHSQDPPIIYRDMKPNNIMLKPDGDIKLIDFGIAKEFKETTSKDTFMFATNGYGAPEQCVGGKTDIRSDIYSLGITLFYLLTNCDPQQEPYNRIPIRQINPTLSGGIENIILKCTQYHPDERYQSANDLLYSLENYQKEDDEYKRLQFKKLKKFMICVITALVSLCISVTSLISIQISNNNNYEEQMELAKSASSIENKKKYYIKAIEILPENTEPYIDLIELYKIEGFTIEEDTELKRLLNSHLSKLQSQTNYGRLAFELGKLYWYYFDYGNSSDLVTKAMSASKWFEDAVDYGKGKNYYAMAEAYSLIGNFYESITQKVVEASDEDMYYQLFLNLNKLYLAIENGNEDLQEIVELESCKLILNLLSSYARQMKNDGITQNEMETLYNKTITYLKKVSTSVETTSLLKEELLNNLPVYKQSIDHAFIKISTEAAYD